MCNGLNLGIAWKKKIKWKKNYCGAGKWDFGTQSFNWWYKYELWYESCHLVNSNISWDGHQDTLKQLWIIEIIFLTVLCVCAHVCVDLFIDLCYLAYSGWCKKKKKLYSLTPWSRQKSNNDHCSQAKNWGCVVKNSSWF